jgi:hypothetical protein
MKSIIDGTEFDGEHSRFIDANLHLVRKAEGWWTRNSNAQRTTGSPRLT